MALRSLEGKVAWVTGAGSGIGQAGAKALAGAGMVVVLSGRTAATLQETADQIGAQGGRAAIELLDVADAGAVEAVAGRIEANQGRLDVLVSSAGVNARERYWKNVSVDGWDDVVDVDLSGAFYCAKAALPMMRAQGDGLIVNVSSWAGKYDTFLTGPAYNAAKHGLVALNASLNLEECVNGIRACAVCPGEVATPILDRRPVPVSAEDKARMVQTDDMAELILFIAQMPPHVCLNEIIVSPTWNRFHIAQQNFA